MSQKSVEDENKRLAARARYLAAQSDPLIIAQEAEKLRQITLQWQEKIKMEKELIDNLIVNKEYMVSSIKYKGSDIERPLTIKLDTNLGKYIGTTGLNQDIYLVFIDKDSKKTELPLDYVFYITDVKQGGRRTSVKNCRKRSIKRRCKLYKNNSM